MILTRRSGKLAGYLSLEGRLEKLAADVTVLELNPERTEEEEAKLVEKKAAVEKLRASIGAGSIRIGRCGDDATRSNNDYACDACKPGTYHSANSCRNCPSGQREQCPLDTSIVQ